MRPERPLNRVLDRALESLAERLGRFRARPAGEAVDFFWNRPSPRVVVRENDVQQHVHVSPTVLVNVSRPIAASSAEGAPATVQPAERVPASMLLRTLERRVETRVVDRSISVLRQTIDRRHTTESGRVPPPAADERAPLQLVVRTDAPVARTEMVFVRTPSSPADAEPARRSDSASPGAAPRNPASPPLPQAPALRMDRITAEVIRALDARLIAQRERMGRS